MRHTHLRRQPCYSKIQGVISNFIYFSLLHLLPPPVEEGEKHHWCTNFLTTFQSRNWNLMTAFQIFNQENATSWIGTLLNVVFLKTKFQSRNSQNGCRMLSCVSVCVCLIQHIILSFRCQSHVWLSISWCAAVLFSWFSYLCHQIVWQKTRSIIFLS